MGKRAAILEAAKALFIRNAFAGTSMDAVAAEAGVSKLTVYSHFGDKDNLFREVIRARIQEFLPEDIFQYEPGDDIGGVLLNIALQHARNECNPSIAGTFRAILSDCRQGNPRYGRMLWEEGPAHTHKLLQDLLQKAADAGALDIQNASLASTQFYALLKGDLLLRRLFGCEDCAVAFAAEIESNARAAVDVFLRAYLPR
ncbi:TetR/AcrR family transcriptional regulator [Frateuria defendens]|uniref:TetR/AcrR family transcriptional regulator n=1 Tax=Frateuria defendens TaxID=2219559 RepID=UPI001F46FCA6|nr:TetR/AcrR family transcriptional regulator [Frateuria defendens]